MAIVAQGYYSVPMNSTLIVVSFSVFLLAFTAIGAFASRKKRDSSEDYLIASRDVNPWLVALSAVSTNNSGYMFIGLIGYTWQVGVQAVWISVGWVFGDLLTWFWVHKRVRHQSEAVGARSVPGLLATDKDGVVSRPIAAVAGVLTFMFLGGYAAAQLKAGSITLNAVFGWPMWTGAVIGAVIVAIYCMAGGIRASIWTDAAQSVVMLCSMALLLGACTLQVGGLSSLYEALNSIDPSLVSVIPQGLAWGFGLYLLGFVFAGIGTIGQPHILVRFMAIDETKSIAKARNIYFTWYTGFSIACILVGLYSRVLLPELGMGLTGAELETAAESALPQLSILMLTPVLIGVMLAGLFSATMSTADSQILSCSAAVTQDVFPRWSNSVVAAKVATISVAILALFIALFASSGVFWLVMLAWAALAAAIGPILLVRLAGLPLSTNMGVVMIVSGLVTTVAWGFFPFAGNVYRAMPGMLVPMVIYGAAYLISNRPKAS